MEKEQQKDIALDLQATTINSLFEENRILKRKIEFIRVIINVAENTPESKNDSPFCYGYNKGAKFVANEIKGILDKE